MMIFRGVVSIRAAAATAGPAGSGGESGWLFSVGSWAHSSAGERPLHTREVPGSIPGAPIVISRVVKRFVRRGRVGCPLLVQLRLDASTESRRLTSPLALVQVSVPLEEESAAVCMPQSF